jgi:hypothetical protein
MATGTWKPALLVLGVAVFIAPLYIRSYPTPVDGSVVVITGKPNQAACTAKSDLKHGGFHTMLCDQVLRPA